MPGLDQLISGRQMVGAQQHDGTDDCFNKPCRLPRLVPAQELSEISRRQRAADAERSREKKAPRAPGPVPGVIAFAMSPATKPMRMVQMRCMKIFCLS